VCIAIRTRQQFTQEDPDQLFRELPHAITRSRLFRGKKEKITRRMAPGDLTGSEPLRLQALPGVFADAASRALISLFCATAALPWELARPTRSTVAAALTVGLAANGEVSLPRPKCSAWEAGMAAKTISTARITLAFMAISSRFGHEHIAHGRQPSHLDQAKPVTIADLHD
jgi:hypothetical protein